MIECHVIKMSSIPCRNVNSHCERIEIHSLHCSSVASESVQVAARKLKRRFIKYLSTRRHDKMASHMAIEFFDYKIEMAIIIGINTRNRYDCITHYIKQ